jgi:hypothetical protein
MERRIFNDGNRPIGDTKNRYYRVAAGVACEISATEFRRCKQAAREGWPLSDRLIEMTEGSLPDCDFVGFHCPACIEWNQQRYADWNAKHECQHCGARLNPDAIP